LSLSYLGQSLVVQEHKKRLQEMQRKQAVKEVRFSPTTAENDMQVPALGWFKIVFTPPS
jgi:translation initiation factor IF-3